MKKLFGLGSKSASPPPPSSSSSASPAELPKHGLAPTSASGGDDPSNARIGLHLASRLFAQLCGQDEITAANLLVSPLSVGVAMSLAMLGARGATAAQLRGLLTAVPTSATSPAEEAQLVQTLAEEWGRMSKIEERDGTEWASTNGVWLSQDCPVSPEIAALAGHLHGATIKGDLPIPTNPDAARKTINDAIAKQTRDRIKELLPSGSLTSDSRLVITNAVYFKGPWATPFNANFTVKGDFRLLDDAGQVQVDMMHNPSLQASHISFDTHSMLALPFKDRSIAMLILLPHENTAAAFQRLWSPEIIVGIDKAYGQLSRGRVNLWMPKFRLEYQEELSEPIKRLGVELPFENGAQFEGLTRTGEPLKIGAIFHKTFMNVDEAGTEAAAATAVVMSRGGGAPSAPPTPFVIDQPFVCVLYHVHLKCALFVGRVGNPAK